MHDLAEKKESALNYSRKKLCRQNDIYTKVGCALILLSTLTFYAIFLAPATVPEIAVMIYCAFITSIPIAFLYCLIVNEKFQEKIEKDRYRFCEMTKEQRGWVIH